MTSITPTPQELHIASLEGRVMYLEELVGRLLGMHPHADRLAAYEPEYLFTFSDEAAEAESRQDHRNAALARARIHGSEIAQEAIWASAGEGERED